jgi:rhodanese-related sulfurtransferase
MTRTAFVLSALTLCLASGAVLAAPAQKAQDRIPPGLVDGAAARQLVAEGVKVVDVRTPEEFASGHVPGAVNIPYDQMPARAGELGPPSTPVLVYCRSGRRSGVAAQTLKEKGFTRLWDLQAYDRWVAAEPKGK